MVSILLTVRLLGAVCRITEIYELLKGHSSLAMTDYIIVVLSVHAI